MKPILLLLALALGGVPVLAEDLPVVFNPADAGDTPLDRAIKKAYAGKYRIEDILVTSGYASPKPTAGGLPDTAVSEGGEPLEGKVLIAYIITADGTANDPVFLSSSNDQLDQIALRATKEWRFIPGTRKGQPVPTTAAQEFVFRTEKSGLETTNIVLYQADDVLKKRLPGAGQLAAYIGKIQAAATELLSNATTPGTVVIVTAVRPEGTSRVWLMGSGLDGKTQAALRKKLEEIPPVTVKEGPVAFAICGTTAGGAEFTETPPMPPEWKQASEKLPKPVLIPDAVLDAIWPKK